MGSIASTTSTGGYGHRYLPAVSIEMHATRTEAIPTTSASMRAAYLCGVGAVLVRPEVIPTKRYLPAFLTVMTS